MTMEPAPSLLTIYQQIKLAGGRVTNIRRALIDILYASHCLIDKPALQKKLQQKKCNPDRSTLHRELIFLLANNIIRKNSINGVDYFEIAHHHHHHLICLACHHIQPVALPQGNLCHLTPQQENIGKENNFTIVNHSLEYYGYCQTCQA